MLSGGRLNDERRGFPLLSFLATTAPILVGAALLLAALAKALDSMRFALHLTRFPGIPFRVGRIVGPLFLVGESLLGAALVVLAWPRWTLPTALALIVALTAMSAWGLARGQLQECGCYGGLIHLTVPWSLALNGAFIALLSLAVWRGPTPAMLTTMPTPTWKLLVVAAAGLLTVVSVGASWFSVRRRGRPLIIWSPLREGKTWKRAWLGDATPEDLDRGERLIVFLSLDCPQCLQWMKLLEKAVHPHPRLPEVLGVFDLTEDELADLQEIVCFPLVATSGPMIRRLTWVKPFAVLLVDGQIREIWSNLLPESFLGRLRAEAQP